MSYDFDGPYTEVHSLHAKIKTQRRDYRTQKGKGDPQLAPDVLMVMIPGELQFMAEKTGAAKTVFTNMRLYDLYRTKERG